MTRSLLKVTIFRLNCHWILRPFGPQDDTNASMLFRLDPVAALQDDALTAQSSKRSDLIAHSSKPSSIRGEAGVVLLLVFVHANICFVHGRADVAAFVVVIEP